MAAEPAAIVGAWLVRAPDAPFAQHVFAFHADGNMQQTNPPAGNAELSDSAGLGIWKAEGERIIGKFVEVSADRTTREFARRGEISYEISVEGDRFTGTASAVFYGPDDEKLLGPLITALEGTRVRLP